MPRARSIKHSFFTNDELAGLPLSARLLFVGLWTIADREGRLLDRPKKIKAELFPFDRFAVEPLLSALHEHGFINRYVSGSDSIIQVVNFGKHQSPHQKESASTLPASDLHQNGTGPAPDKPDAKLSRAALTVDSGYLTADKGLLTADSGQSGSGASPSASSGSLALLSQLHESHIGTLSPKRGDELRDWAERLPHGDANAERDAEAIVRWAFDEMLEHAERASWPFVASVLKRQEAEGWKLDGPEEWSE